MEETNSQKDFTTLFLEEYKKLTDEQSQINMSSMPAFAAGLTKGLTKFANKEDAIQELNRNIEFLSVLNETFPEIYQQLMNGIDDTNMEQLQQQIEEAISSPEFTSKLMEKEPEEASKVMEKEEEEKSDSKDIASGILEFAGEITEILGMLDETFQEVYEMLSNLYPELINIGQKIEEQWKNAKIDENYFGLDTSNPETQELLDQIAGLEDKFNEYEDLLQNIQENGEIKDEGQGLQEEDSKAKTDGEEIEGKAESTEEIDEQKQEEEQTDEREEQQQTEELTEEEKEKQQTEELTEEEKEKQQTEERTEEETEEQTEKRDEQHETEKTPEDADKEKESGSPNIVIQIEIANTIQSDKIPPEHGEEYKLAEAEVGNDEIDDAKSINIDRDKETEEGTIGVVKNNQDKVIKVVEGHIQGDVESAQIRDENEKMAQTEAKQEHEK